MLMIHARNSRNLEVLNEKLEELREAIAHNPVDFWEYRIAHRSSPPPLLRSAPPQLLLSFPPPLPPHTVP